MNNKWLQSIGSVVLIGLFLCAGLWAGPYIHTTYNQWFPAPVFVTGDYSKWYAKTSKSVVIFTTSTCQYCKHVRELLDQEKVDYYDFITDQSEEAKQHYQTLGEEAVPILFIADRKIVGANDVAIKEALQRLPHSNELENPLGSN